MNPHLKKAILYLPAVAFGRLERKLMAGNVPINYAPIFIIGCPRSGSTLLYQLIAHRFEVSYFSNLMMQFPNSPAVVSRLLAPFDGCNPPHDFSSYYGFVAGLRSPNQGLPFWQRVFPNQYRDGDPKQALKAGKRIVRNTIGVIQNSFESPFVNKCQPNSERILTLFEIFPEVVFIRIKRDPVYIAQSILLGKRALWNDDRRWFSTKPRNYKELSHLEALEQICRQVINIEKDMAKDIAAMGRNNTFTVYYEDLCRTPRQSLDDIQGFYSKYTDVALPIRHDVPSGFENANRVRLNADEFNRLKSHF